MPGSLITVAMLALCVLWVGRITGSAIDGDAGQGLRMALSLEKHGVMSLRTAPPYAPSMYREPFPVAVSAAMVRLHDALQGETATAEYFFGPGARFLKLQNVAWMLLLCLGIFLGIRHTANSTALALLGVALLNVKVPLVPSGLEYIGLNDLETDLPAAALLALGSALLGTGMLQRRKLLLILAGVVLGALALTKAAFLYVFLVLSLFLIGNTIAHRSRSRGWLEACSPLLTVVAFSVVVAGWMVRNYVHFGAFEISERGGVVLLIRAYKDEMTPVEYRGSFYVWAPNALRPQIGRLLGFNSADLDRGGRLQRLNRGVDANFYAEDVAAESAGRPDLAITYYRKARAERVRVRRQLYASGKAAAAADELLKDEALGIIGERPGAHILLTAPFLWRGALLAFPVLLFAWVYAMSRRDYSLGWLVLPALGMVMFYGLLSHFIPRYGLPMHPLALAAALVLANRAWKRWAPASRPVHPGGFRGGSS